MKFDEKITTGWFEGVAANTLPKSKSEVVEVVVTIPAKLVVSKLHKYLANAVEISFDYKGVTDVMGSDFPFIQKIFSEYEIKERKNSLILTRKGTEIEEEYEPEEADELITEEEEE